MGLGENKVKQRFGLDPRNTNWSNDTGRFGHQYLEKMGWAPGKGLGLVEHATTTHVKVVIKDDNIGLGAKLAKRQKKDEFDSGECAGLDVFQRILGRLNGKEDKISDELERQRKEKILNGKWGMHFIKGEVLKSSWDSEAKVLISQDTENGVRKRKNEEGKTSASKKIKMKSNVESEVQSKEARRIKKSRKDKKVEEGMLIEGKVPTKKRTEKAEKKDKGEKKEKAEKNKTDPKKSRKDKSGKREKKEKKEIKKNGGLRSAEPSKSEHPPIATRLSVRSKWIKQKRASVMDAKALNEIFMITN